MTTYGIGELKANLGRILRDLDRGEKESNAASLGKGPTTNEVLDATERRAGPRVTLRM